MKKFSADFFQEISPEWTLFLDRDGVINRRIIDDYIKKPQEFEFLPHVREVLSKLRPLFYKIVVVTNQQGIGKGLMTEQDLYEIHQKMLAHLNEKEILIDKIYFCPDLKEHNSHRRKPQIGMAQDAKNDFPLIDFKKSLMIGDSISDMEFGRNTAMKTLFFGAETDNKAADFWVKTWSEIL